MNNPKISIITVCYNAADTIEKTILSVINQTYEHIEYIIIDGASTDGTVDMVRKYRDKISYFISESDNGIYDAMNKGITMATGEWINFMNAGDCFYDERVLDRLEKELRTISYKVGCIYGDYISVQRRKTVEVLCLTPFFQRENYIENPSMGFHHQSTFVRTGLAKEKMFDTKKFHLCADYNMIYSLYKDGWGFHRVPCFVAIVDGRTGVSASNRALQLKEHYVVLGLSDNIDAIIKVFIVRVKELIKKIVLCFLDKYSKRGKKGQNF